MGTFLGKGQFLGGGLGGLGVAGLGSGFFGVGFRGHGVGLLWFIL